MQFRTWRIEMSEKKKILPMPPKKIRTAEARADHKRRKAEADPRKVARFRAALGTYREPQEESNG